MIEHHLTQEAKEFFDGKVTLDESYFDGIYKSECGAGSKTAVFGLLKQNNKVYTDAVKDTTNDMLMPIIATTIKTDSFYTYSYRSDSILDVSDFKHLHINHPKAIVAQDCNHTNGIEGVWNKAKRVLRKYNSVDKKTLILLSKNASLDLTMARHCKNLRPYKNGVEFKILSTSVPRFIKKVIG